MIAEGTLGFDSDALKQLHTQLRMGAIDLCAALRTLFEMNEKLTASLKEKEAEVEQMTEATAKDNAEADAHWRNAEEVWKREMEQLEAEKREAVAMAEKAIADLDTISQEANDFADRLRERDEEIKLVCYQSVAFVRREFQMEQELTKKSDMYDLLVVDAQRMLKYNKGVREKVDNCIAQLKKDKAADSLNDGNVSETSATDNQRGGGQLCDLPVKLCVYRFV